jgi:hypothetical protein
VARPPAVTITDKPTRYPTKTVTGAEIELLHQREVDYYVTARDRYLTDFKFTIASDFRSLDRLLLLEVQNFRCMWQLTADTDYQGIDLDNSERAMLSKAIRELGVQIAYALKYLGLTKAQRDRANDEDPGVYLENLRIRAKEHGIKREREVSKAIELSKELFSLCGAYQRANENERRKLGFDSAEDILTWVMEYMRPEFNAIDEAYRKGQQKFWLRSI